ncbi:hypothetical protein HPB49_002635 [Dermacentor silvarum]|uniref:Uncharacterized protein n=1 Tax=Dermacentor silvarum TaxID=543639 RepID=A0ACB8DA86_DERSI|nr:hypothetical protein HPB49_002635 [Dermacentor silvarum]
MFCKDIPNRDRHPLGKTSDHSQVLKLFYSPLAASPSLSLVGRSTTSAAAFGAKVAMAAGIEVEGEELTAEEMARWREQHIFRASKPPNAIALSSQPRRPGKMVWPRQPLPPDDSYTAVVRIRGGLDCPKYHPIYLKRMMREAAQLAEDIDSARVNTLNNASLITSTRMDHIDAYLRVKSLTIAVKTHEVVVHPTSPQDSCKGIFALPINIKEAEILPHLRQANPGPPVLHARRMAKTETIMVTILGKKVPFCVQYAHFWLHCTPFRQKEETCVKCKQIGHRPDVCPVVCVSTCEKCG